MIIDNKEIANIENKLIIDDKTYLIKSIQIQGENLENFLAKIYNQLNNDQLKIDEIIEIIKSKIVAMKDSKTEKDIVLLQSFIQSLIDMLASKQNNSNLIIKFTDSVKDIVKFVNQSSVQSAGQVNLNVILDKKMRERVLGD